MLSAAALAASTTEPLLLWPEGAPGALGNSDNDKPTLTPFVAPTEMATGAAMLVCPGGGYVNLTAYEGDDYAKWFNTMGISAFVLKYRLSKHGYHHPAMQQDVTRAMRMIRAGASKWNIDATRIGIIGSSAGGHLASTLMTHFDAGHANSTDPIEVQSSRPDLGILCYPVITFEGEFTHVGSMENLLGRNPPTELKRFFSNERQVTKDSPPAFLFHTADDAVVRVENSLIYAMACAKNDVPVSLHIYPSGPHGLGLGRTGTPHPWTGQCALWLQERGFAR